MGGQNATLLQISHKLWCLTPTDKRHNPTWSNFWSKNNNIIALLSSSSPSLFTQSMCTVRKPWIVHITRTNLTNCDLKEAQKIKSNNKFIYGTAQNMILIFLRLTTHNSEWTCSPLIWSLKIKTQSIFFNLNHILGFRSRSTVYVNTQMHHCNDCCNDCIISFELLPQLSRMAR